MTLLVCHECGHKVSSEAKACPSCGAAVRSVKNRGRSALRWIWYGACGLVLSIVFVSCYNATSALNRV